MLPDRFETPRLILRTIAADDAPAIFTGYAHPGGCALRAVAPASKHRRYRSLYHPMHGRTA